MSILNFKKAATFWWWVVIGVLCCILVVLLTVAFTMESSKTEKVNLQKALEAYIDDEKNDGENLPLMLQYQNEILDAITFEIRSYDIDAGTMIVKFTYMDVLALADKAVEPQLSENAYYIFCMERISKKKYTTKNETIEVHFKPSKSGYTIVKSDELVNVLSGGVLSYYLERLEEVGH